MARATPGRVFALGAVLGAIVVLLVGGLSLAWWPTHGVVAGGAMVPLVLLALRRPLEEAARGIAGEEGPRIFWRASWIYALLFTVAVADGWHHAFLHGHTALDLGYVGLDSVPPLAVPALFLGGIFGACSASLFAWLLAPIVADPIPRALHRVAVWLPITVASFVLLAASAKALVSPSPSRWASSLERVGTIAEVDLWQQPPGYEHDPLGTSPFPRAMPEERVGPYYARRFCNGGSCQTFVARAPLPSRYDEARILPGTWSFGGLTEAVELRRDPALGMLGARDRYGLRFFVREPGFEPVTDARVLSRRLGVPAPLLACSALGIALAIFSVTRRSRGLRALEVPWREARMTDDGLLHFDDGTAPAQPPPGERHAAGPVLVTLAEDGERSPTFRAAGAPTVARVFRGTREAIAARIAALRDNDPVFAVTAALLPSAPLFAAWTLGMCGA